LKLIVEEADSGERKNGAAPTAMLGKTRAFLNSFGFMGEVLLGFIGVF